MTMGDAYAAFVLDLAIVAALGGIAAWKRLGIGQRALQNANALVTMLGVMTSAALLSVAFLGAGISAPGSLRLLPSSDLHTAIGWTGQVLLFGGSGLSCALIGLTILRGDRSRRWAGGCLTVSCLAVLALFPAPVVLILEAADAAATH